MKVINGVIIGLISGFIGSLFVAPRSGRETRNRISMAMNKPLKNVRMFYNELAFKLRLISEKKKADLNKATVTTYNERKNKNKVASPMPSNNTALKASHEKSAATKAVDSATAKSGLRKVPVNTK